MLAGENADLLFFVVGQPKVAWHPSVVFVDLAEAVLPVMELAVADADPGQEARGRDLGLLAPAGGRNRRWRHENRGEPSSLLDLPKIFFYLGMCFHEFGQDLVLAGQLGFQLFDLPMFGVLDGLAFAAALEGPWPFSKNSLSQP